MADSANPLHLSVRKKNAELVIVIGFFHNCPFDRARPPMAILRVDAFEIFFPSWRSLSWIEAENPIELLGDLHRVPIRYAPSPAARMSQLLRLGQVRLLALQFLCQQLLFGDIHCGAEKPLEEFAFNNGNSDAANVALLAVGANNSLFDIAARAFRLHSHYGVSHEIAVLWVNGSQILFKCRGSLLRI